VVEKMKKNEEKNDKKNASADENKSELNNIFKSNRVLGIVGNQNTAKSSLVLSELLLLKKEHKDMNIYVFGVEQKLKPYLEKHNIIFLHNMEDILDLKIRDSVIYIDEVSTFVSTKTKDRQTDRFKRFINRIVHQNDWLIISTAEVGFFNKLACSMINAFIIKEIELDSLVNNTWLKRLVKGLPRTSDYRVDMNINEFYVLLNNDLTKKCNFLYNPNLDSKAENVNPFK
jgi:hypothetical protein